MTAISKLPSSFSQAPVIKFEVVATLVATILAFAILAATFPPNRDTPDFEITWSLVGP